ncbi:hypothetical protein BHF68_14840 [Desulfuribacillus alkaliarsenatis]|uniref:Peptidase A2 domain-containing protein n=2 Tax=Desulfuribacillus alkaliarsenatis TaxID=766136 RepID=A0A1E5G2H9_9FIRM|nr:hypothetical protein BHF68_14840 [Desulfuribacillus alkaliarsenatis]
MKKTLNINHQLPFVQLRIWYRGHSLLMKNVLIDNGSASTIFKLDTVEEIGLIAEAEDTVGTISGVGGSECLLHLNRTTSVMSQSQYVHQIEPVCASVRATLVLSLFFFRFLIASTNYAGCQGRAVFAREVHP